MRLAWSFQPICKPLWALSGFGFVASQRLRLGGGWCRISHLGGSSYQTPGLGWTDCPVLLSTERSSPNQQFQSAFLSLACVSLSARAESLALALALLRDGVHLGIQEEKNQGGL